MSDNLNSSGSSSEETPQDVYERLAYEWSSLSDRVTLSTVSDELSNVGRDVSELEDYISEIRSKGYVFGGDWEGKAEEVRSRWPREKRAAERELDQQTQIVRDSADEVERLLNRAERSHNLLDDLERKLESFESEVSAAEQNVRRAFERSSDELGEVYEEIEWATFLVENLRDSAFKLNPEENGVAACKAKWMSKKGEPEGVLYLTDQRVFYEQIEEVATKKVLFITTEKETVREMAWQAPVGAIDKHGAEDKGGVLGFGVKELLTINFNRDAKDVPNEVTMRFLDYADNEMWENLIEQVKSGRIAKSKYSGAVSDGEHTHSEASDSKTIPTTCTSCGGKLPKAFKGMRQLECEFCGQVVSL
ncbi:MAG: hypothetical protein ISR58_04970 [Anaerolineales bacterium]|nr:hypothetical protein [Chloroflexota bacterium]MBL6980524.1 hypothetical protein [Anaerolineales bacterium]